jgi:hypothetical protein
MPKLPHEALVHLVRSAPEVIFHLLRHEFGVDLPLHAPRRVTAAEFVDLNFAEHRADAILTVGDPGRPAEAFVVEAQTDIDPRKRRSWPIYVAGPHARLGCPVTLVVIAPDPAVAAWAATPIDLGRGRTIVRPLVIGPAQIPVITDHAEARRFPELAVLSVVAHGREPGAEHIALAALAASRDLDSERDIFYADFVLAHLGKVARKALEQLMPARPYEFQSDFARKYFYGGKAEGIAEGKARMLLRQLRRKGFAVDAAVEARLADCKDDDQLDTWADRVLTATSLDEVFAA